jgi:hypothetical protein
MFRRLNVHIQNFRENIRELRQNSARMYELSKASYLKSERPKITMNLSEPSWVVILPLKLKVQIRCSRSRGSKLRVSQSNDPVSQLP